MTKDVRGYLQDMVERIDRILQYTQAGRENFFASDLIQDAVARNFEILGEITKRLEKSFTDQHPEIPWRQMAAFRDVIIHDYEDLQLQIVWKTITDELPKLQTQLQAILESLEPPTP
jgi:uncharacterized protein with HEPN domain